MRHAGEVLFGAWLASAAIQQCSCFTATRIRVVSNPKTRPASSAQFSTSRPSSTATPSSQTAAAAAVAAAAAAAKGGDDMAAVATRHRRRTTLLSYGRTTVDVAPDIDVEERFTSQQLQAEVAARTTKAWGLVGFPSQAEGLFGEAGSSPAPAGGGGGGAAVEGDAADREWHQRQDCDQEEAEKQRRLLDMTRPPPELLRAAQTRPVGDNKGATAVAEPQEGQQTVGGGQVDGQVDGEEGGASMWASRGMLAGAAMLYGTNFGCVKLLEESLPMSLAAALRFSVALVPFIPFLKKVNPGVFKAGAEVGLLNAIGYWAQSESLMTTTASKSAFICSLAVVFVPVLDALMGAKDSPDAAGAKAVKRDGGGVFAAMNGPWFPALLAASGVACLELIGVEGGPNSGDVWAMVQPLCFGLGFWLTERCSRKYPDEIFGLVAAQLLTVAVLAVAWCAQAGDLPLSVASLKEIVLPSSGNLAVPISLIWTGLITTSLTVFGETLAMKKVSAAESTIILSTEPIWGTAFAAFLLGERIGWNTGLGALLIVSACTWSSMGPALQAKMLSLVAAVAGASSVVEGGMVDVDDLAETMGTVIQEIVKD
eukprot:g8935.t1